MNNEQDFSWEDLRISATMVTVSDFLCTKPPAETDRDHTDKLHNYGEGPEKPIIAATLTTVAAFLPLMLLPGIIGRFLRVIPLTVAIALIASTFESIVFLPIHFAE